MRGRLLIQAEALSSCLPVRLMMEASPAPMTILHARRVQKLFAKPQPTEETMKMAMPHPANIGRWFSIMSWGFGF